MKSVNLNIQGTLYSQYVYFRGHAYTEGTALSEFIDNSTASYILHKDQLKEKVRIEINYDQFTRTLTIYDNAFGMNEENFHKALIFGSSPEVVGRNQYGYGMKVAATWFGTRWSVESTELGSNEKFYGCIDMDELKNNTTNEIEVRSTVCDVNEHYTLIKIEKVDKTISTSKVKKEITEFLQKKYSRDVKKGDVEIIFDSVMLEFHDHEPLVFQDKVYKKDIFFEFDFEDKHYKVDGFVGLLKNGGAKKSGFALFHNDRTIIQDFKPLEIISQSRSHIDKNLYGELNMDSFEVTQQKNDINWNAELREKFIELLKNEIRDYIKVASISNKDRDILEIEYQERKKQPKVDDGVIIINSPQPESPKTEVTDSKINKNGNDESTLITPGIDKEKEQIPVSVPKNDEETIVVGKTSEVENTEGKEKENIIKKLVVEGETYEINYISNNSGLYKFINNIKRFELNLSYPYLKKYNGIIPEDIVKLLLCLAISEYEAINTANGDGYTSPTFIRHKLEDLLKK